MSNCPLCGKPLKRYTSAYGGGIFMGCSDIRNCNYKRQIN
jgi:ssDNA-binding Zn-finger/Zn-ribbon topoisomerase 1